MTLLLSLHVSAHAEAAPCTSAQAAVLMLGDGTCLYEHKVDDRHLIASTTKIMTAIVSIENAELDDEVKIKPEHCSVEGSSMYLKVGEKYTVRELLTGLLLSSGNDAAVALAEHVSGSERAFVNLMNKKAQELDMGNTNFVNPHGLNESAHYSSARDMARLMHYCMENSIFRELCGTHSATIKGETHINHNKLLTQYKGCVAGKTGYTIAAGRCLVTCCERDGMRLVCVTLDDPRDWSDHTALYDWAYENYSYRDVLSAVSFDVPVVSGSRETVTIIPGEKLELLLRRDEEIRLEAHIPRFVFAPVNLGETAGYICVIINNETVAECPLVYADDVLLAYPCFN